MVELIGLVLVVIGFFIYSRVNDIDKRMKGLEQLIRSQRFKEKGLDDSADEISFLTEDGEMRGGTPRGSIDSTKSHRPVVLEPFVGNASMQRSEEVLSPPQPPSPQDERNTHEEVLHRGSAFDSDRMMQESQSQQNSHDQVDLDPTIFDRFAVWVKNDWPMKVGGLLVILAIGWFVGYAADHDLISEIARVMLGYLVGITALIYGTLRSEKVRVQGNVFLTIGVAAIFVSTLAGVKFPEVAMPESIALFAMLVTVCYVSLVSLKQKSFSLTASMISFGALIPLFFFEGLTPELIFGYLLALTAGSLWVVSRTQWRGLTLLMLVVVGLYSLGYKMYYGEVISVSNMILALVFSGIFYCANVSSLVKAGQKNIVDYATALGVTILYLVWTFLFAPESLHVLLLLFGALSFVLASYFLFLRRSNAEPMAIYGGSAFILIAIATAKLFDGPILTIAYLMEATVLLSATVYVLGDRMTQGRQVLGVVLYSAPLLLLLASITQVFRYIQGGYFAGDLLIVDVVPHLFALFVAMLCAFALAMIVRTHMNMENEDNHTFMLTFAYLGAALTVVFVWLATHVFFGEGAYEEATFVSLFIYMVAGMAFYILGVKERQRSYQVVGGALFAIVLLRIFVVEFWSMEIPMRIVTFFVIGVLFIVVAYIARSRRQD